MKSVLLVLVLVLALVMGVSAEKQCWLRCQDYQEQVWECSSTFCWTDDGAIYVCLRGTEEEEKCALQPEARKERGMDPIQGCPLIGSFSVTDPINFTYF